MKKLIGYFLISLPFIGLLTYAYIDNNLINMIIAFGIAIIIAGMIILGLYLIVKDN
jgi:hypothetical protein